MKYMKRLILIILSLFVVLGAYAQQYAEKIKANPAMAAANLMNYHFESSVLTPAPKGYEAFYISHFGRHGSRYDGGDENMLAAWPIMKKADSLGLFTEAGQKLFKDLNAVKLEQDGMYGMLTSLGAREHRGIAQRMASNFPEVFKGEGGRKEIYCQSSIVPRCIISMTNFAHSLSANTSGLNFTLMRLNVLISHSLASLSILSSSVIRTLLSSSFTSLWMQEWQAIAEITATVIKIIRLICVYLFRKSRSVPISDCLALQTTFRRSPRPCRIEDRRMSHTSDIPSIVPDRNRDLYVHPASGNIHRRRQCRPCLPLRIYCQLCLRNCIHDIVRLQISTSLNRHSTASI